MAARVAVGEEPSDRQAEVAAEHVDDHAAADVKRRDLAGEEAEVDVEPVEHGLHEGHDHQLRRRRLTKHSAVADHHRTRSEEAVQQAERLHGAVFRDGVVELGLLRGREAVEDDGPLAHNGGEKERVADRAEAVTTEESHQISETDENHHIDISVGEREMGGDGEFAVRNNKAKSNN